MSDLPIRPVEYDEFAAFRDVLANAFGGPPDEESDARERELLEFDRTLAAFDGEVAVGSAGAFSLDLTVPGGSVPTAGVTWVGVLPTYRRRGVLTAMMRRQLDDIHAAGMEPIAALWASEPPIYGRFGYGHAAPVVRLSVPRSANTLRPVPAAADLRARLVDPEEAVPLVAPVYDHDRARRPGMFALPDSWQQIRTYLAAHEREGASGLRTVLLEDGDGVRAYGRYVTRAEWTASGPESTVVVREVHACDAAAVAAVWTYLLDIDLSAKIEVRLRPIDDPLLGLLVNPRRAAISLSDGLYVRVVEVGPALAARTYTAPIDVVLDVRDEFCPWNAGHWRLAGDATGASCERTVQPADVQLDVRELGAAYLGGTSLFALADAGFVVEHTAGAVRELSTALRHEPAPWCPIIF